jgi:hypothetical protein
LKEERERTRTAEEMGNKKVLDALEKVAEAERQAQETIKEEKERFDKVLK